MLIEMLKMLYREINMQRFCAQCISSWASSDKTLQSYSPDNSLFHTFPVTDDDAYTCTVPTSNHMCIHRYQQVHQVPISTQKYLQVYTQVPMNLQNYRTIHCFTLFLSRMMTHTPACTNSAMHLARRRRKGGIWKERERKEGNCRKKI